MASFPSAAQGDRTLVRGWYRFLDHPAESALTPQNILTPHRERTLGRMQDQGVVLAVQDGTELNFAEHGGCVGLGHIGRNKGADGTRGLHLHSMLAVSEQGLPLGVLRMEFDAPPPAKARKATPPEQRKTQRWVRGLRDCAEIAGRLAGTRVVSVMDREADFFELFAEQRRLGGVDLLVRAKHNRNLPLTAEQPETPQLFDWIRAQPGQARLEIDVARVSERVGTRNQPASALRAARTAAVTLRWQAVSLPAPEDSPSRGERPVQLWAVHVAEEAAPTGVEPLEWLLLTSEPVRTQAAAERVLRRYRLRWRIEDWHRVLKSGCKVEDLANRTRERIERGVAINAVIAWRLHLMTLLGRETPELPAETLFSDIEIRVLNDFAQQRGEPQPTDLGQAVQLVAVMGGYLKFRRKQYALPGVEILWKGYVRLAPMAQLVERTLSLNQSSAVAELIRQRQGP